MPGVPASWAKTVRVRSEAEVDDVAGEVRIVQVKDWADVMTYSE